MKYAHEKYYSEKEALRKILGTTDVISENIIKPYHHKDRVKVYPGFDVAKKYRSASPRSIQKTHLEANAHKNLEKIDVNSPKLYGILHNEEECSIFMEYIKSIPLTSLMVDNSAELPRVLNQTGAELGKLFENRYLHGDLTSYHVFVNGVVHLFDLETTRKFGADDFYFRLKKEWVGFISSKQGRRWNIPFSKEQEEMIFEGARAYLSDAKTKDILEHLVMNN